MKKIKKDVKSYKVSATFTRCLFSKECPSRYGKSPYTWKKMVWNVNKSVFEENNLIFKEGEDILVVGSIYTDLKLGKTYTIVVTPEINEKYGPQNTLNYIDDMVDFSSPKESEVFLKAIFSEKMVEALFEVSENPIELLQNEDIAGLCKAKGVREHTAKKLISRFYNNQDKASLYVALKDYEFTHNFLGYLMNAYSTPSVVIDKVTNHPYDLMYEVRGVGFRKADQIALKGEKYSPKGVDRLKAGICFVLQRYAESGNSYMFYYDLKRELLSELLNVPDPREEDLVELLPDSSETNLSKAFSSLQNEGKIMIEECENEYRTKISLRYYYCLEESIAYHLKRLLESPNKFAYSNWKEKIKAVEEKQGWNFTEEQVNGIKLALDSQVSFITGGAGCGKSSLVSGVLAALSGYDFAQCSLSGKAAARLKEVTGEDGYTIHRLLEFSPRTNDDKLKDELDQDSMNTPFKYTGSLFKHNYYKTSPLLQDIIIVDEISLIGGEIFLDLLRAIDNGTKLIMLGDMGQLESIGCMNLAKDIYNSDIIPKVELTKIHRQAEKSGIITTSQDVRNEIPISLQKGTREIRGELEDMIIQTYEKVEEGLPIIERFYDRALNSKVVNNDFLNLQVIVPVRDNREVCVNSVNKLIQDKYNPVTGLERLKNQVIVCGFFKEKPIEIHKGDKVMCIKNTYGVPGYEVNDEDVSKKVWTQEDVFNGWTGIVDSVAEKSVYVYFPIVNKMVSFTYAEARNNLTLGYASTCHKMQGSSNPFIIGVIDNCIPPNMRTKELLYTMITRAEKYCVLLGQGLTIKSCSKKSGIESKKTYLNELLLEDIENLKRKLVLEDDPRFNLI